VSRGFLLVLCLFAAAPSALRAHDPYTSWTDLRVLPDRLELTLTLSRGSALRLLPNADKLAPITDDNFAGYAEPLRIVAPLLFFLVADGKPLRLVSAAPKLGDEKDLIFVLAYPRPPAAALRIRADYLRLQVDGHVGTVAAMDPAGQDLGWGPLNVDEPELTVKLPPAK
jgi:hypothetical protein